MILHLDVYVQHPGQPLFSSCSILSGQMVQAPEDLAPTCLCFAPQELVVMRAPPLAPLDEYMPYKAK